MKTLLKDAIYETKTTANSSAKYGTKSKFSDKWPL